MKQVKVGSDTYYLYRAYETAIDSLGVCSWDWCVATRYNYVMLTGKRANDGPCVYNPYPHHDISQYYIKIEVIEKLKRIVALEQKKFFIQVLLIILIVVVFITAFFVVGAC